MEGFISLHRDIQSHWLYQEERTFSKYEAWLDMLMMANSSPGKALIGRELIDVDRGSFISSELKLMTRWKWSKSKIRAFFVLLEKDGMLKKIADEKKTSFFILNYGKYQLGETRKRPEKDTNNKVLASSKELSSIIYIAEFTEKFQEAYKAWIDDRKKRKKPVTERAQELQLKRCREWGEEKAIKIIEQAIEKSWTGLEDYGEKKSGGYQKPEKKSLTQIFNDNPSFF